MSKDNKRVYCRMRGGDNKDCAITTYNKNGICQRCQCILQEMMTYMEFAKQLGLTYDTRNNEIEEV